eukprot:gnl/TRDRNA2_/TRDRNA2_29463_c0_seq1.p1 gnl/TRDRNA2_/TRDRNA2_29463_c0~~gnl/TRDRNA2_/TRDRNA2_29463_c0_seq1.p1  ORF type:complete len:238 (-),score=38.57 gnl/TRDRNA2_/TRDRNA2_29463_c0_seq1:6-674(-)
MAACNDESSVAFQSAGISGWKPCIVSRYGNAFDILDWLLRCTSSLAMAAVVAAAFPTATPLPFVTTCAVLCAASLVHHAIDESLPSKEISMCPSSRWALAVDAWAITSTCGVFFACLLLPGGAVLSRGGPAVMALGLAGGAFRQVKLMMFVLTMLAVLIFQTDAVGHVVAAAVEATVLLLFWLMLRNHGKWAGAGHLWAWHTAQALYLMVAARVLVHRGQQA